MLIAASFLIPSGGIEAQDAAPAYVRGEVLLGWHAGVVACEPTGPSAAEPGLSPEACRLLADLAPADFHSVGLLAEQRGRPEWQAAASSLAALTGLEVRELLLPYGVARLGVTPGSEVTEIERLSKLPWVAHAVPNYIVQAAAPPAQVLYPNDPLIGYQWNMRRVSSPQAWAVTQGSPSIVVAVLDSGVDLDHPEFTGRLLPGVDYVNGDYVPDDDNGHGTHVAGLIAANAGNSTGISGLAPNVRLVPLKVLDSQGAGSYANIIAAIYDATNPVINARIINMSLGGFDDDPLLQNAVNYALGSGLLVVAASGNCAQGGTGCPGVNPAFYPAAYPGVLAVGSSDHFDDWASYSGYHPYIGLAAPGGIATDRVWSTWPDGYADRAGTSMATSLVSAAAALVWTVRPTATPLQVIDALQATAEKIGPYPYINGRNDYFGYGRLNVAGAVRLAHPPALAADNPVQRFLTGDPSASLVRAVTLTNPGEEAVLWQAQVTQGAGWLSVSPSSGQTTYSNPSSLILRARPIALPPALYVGTVRVTPVAPSQLPPVDIYVELRVVTQLRHAYLPDVGRDWYGIGWLDPFEPGAPAPLDLGLANNSAYPVALPFPVTFYGQAYTLAWISDNGLVWFGAGSSLSLQPPTTCLPSAAVPNNAIYVLALDWNPALGGRVYVHQPDADTYAITWHEVWHAWSTAPQSFQLVFRRAGEIVASYHTVEAPSPALIGTEYYDGTVAEQILCSGVGRQPSNGDTLRLRAVLPW